MSGSTGPWMPWPWTVRYPSKWFHPVKAAVTVTNAAGLAALDSSWSPTAGMADIRRTETEADQVILHALTQMNAAITAATPSGNVAAVNKFSASNQEVLDTGGPLGKAATGVRATAENGAAAQDAKAAGAKEQAGPPAPHASQQQTGPHRGR